MNVKWKCGRICCLKAIKHRMHLHRLLICTIIVCFTKLPTPCRRSLRFLRPKIRTLEKMSTRFPLQSPLFLLGLFLLLLVDGRSICCSRACLFCRIKPLAIAAAMSQKQGCWTPYTQSTDNNNKPPDLSQLLSHFCDCLFALPFDTNGWRSKISTHHERWYKTPNWHNEQRWSITWLFVFHMFSSFQTKQLHGEVARFTGYFSFLTMVFTWVARFIQIYDTDIYSAVHSRSRGSPIRHLPCFLPGPDEIQHAGQRRPLPETKGFFASELWETRPPSSPRWSPATTHIPTSHIFAKFTTYPRRFPSNVQSSWGRSVGLIRAETTARRRRVEVSFSAFFFVDIRILLKGISSDDRSPFSHVLGQMISQ